MMYSPKAFRQTLMALTMFLLVTGWLGCKQRQNSSKEASTENSLPPLADSLKTKAQNWLVRDPSIESYFQINERGIVILDAADSIPKEEIVVLWKEVPAIRKAIKEMDPIEFNEFIQEKGVNELSKIQSTASQKRPIDFRPDTSSGKPLSGLRIALDPGHFGGNMEFAEFEKKFVKIKGRKLRGFKGKIAFNEGNRALETALLLKMRLESLGASVMLTRDEYGKGAAGLSFEEWKAGAIENDLKEFGKRYQMDEKQVAAWRKKATDKDLFRKLFLRFDFEKGPGRSMHLHRILR